MKAIKTKSLMSLIYAVLIALPLCAIFSRVIYVQSNKNAHLSYADGLVFSNTNDINNVNDFVVGNYYSIYRDESKIETTYTSGLEFLFYYDNNGVNEQIFDYNNMNMQKYQFRYGTTTSTNYARLFSAGDVIANIPLYYNNTYYDENNVLQYYGGIENIDNISMNGADILIGGVYVGTFKAVDIKYLPNYRDNSSQTTLDNVFEYSLSQFVSDNDFGQLNLFSWFTDLFLSNNSHNQLYVHFANWYLNYAMLVSLMQILFLVLMWFVNFSRKLLDRGMNYDW